MYPPNDKPFHHFERFQSEDERLFEGKYGYSRPIVKEAVSPPEHVKYYARNVVYAAPNGYKLTMDVSWPDGPGPFPFLVPTHGGSWEQFSRKPTKDSPAG